MNWKGKLVGLLLGLLLRNRVAIVLGLVLGHLYDMGVFSAATRPRADDAAPAAAPPEGDPYAVLGIASAAGDEELELAYRRLMSEYHPDRVASAAPEIRELADRRAREINRAYDQIKRQRGL